MRKLSFKKIFRKKITGSYSLVKYCAPKILEEKDLPRKIPEFQNFFKRNSGPKLLKKKFCIRLFLKKNSKGAN